MGDIEPVIVVVHIYYCFREYFILQSYNMFFFYKKNAVKNTKIFSLSYGHSCYNVITPFTTAAEQYAIHREKETNSSAQTKAGTWVALRRLAASPD